LAMVLNPSCVMVSIPYRYKQNNSCKRTLTQPKIVSIPYRYKQNQISSPRARILLSVSIPYRYKQNYLLKKYQNSCRMSVSIPYRYKQNNKGCHRLRQPKNVSIPYRYKQNKRVSEMAYSSMTSGFQSPIGTNKTYTYGPNSYKW